MPKLSIIIIIVYNLTLAKINYSILFPYNLFVKEDPENMEFEEEPEQEEGMEKSHLEQAVMHVNFLKRLSE